MPKIIAIHSYRGGTGKSNTAANLAAMIASQGKRVGVIDTDLPSPGIHVLFGLQQNQLKHTLNDFLWGKCGISDAAHDVTSVLQKLANPQSKIFLVPSSTKLNDISRVLREGFDHEILGEGFQSLIKTLKLDYLLIDTHPGLNEETLLSLTIAEIVILVLRPDQQDFQGTAVTVDVARRLQVPRLLLLVNKVFKDYNFAQIRQQIENTYKLPIIAILPESDDLIKLASSGILSVKFPQHPISGVFRQVALSLLK